MNPSLHVHSLIVELLLMEEGDVVLKRSTNSKPYEDCCGWNGNNLTVCGSHSPRGGPPHPPAHPSIMSQDEPDQPGRQMHSPASHLPLPLQSAGEHVLIEQSAPV